MDLFSSHVTVMSIIWVTSRKSKNLHSNHTILVITKYFYSYSEIWNWKAFSSVSWHTCGDLKLWWADSFCWKWISEPELNDLQECRHTHTQLSSAFTGNSVWEGYFFPVSLYASISPILNPVPPAEHLDLRVGVPTPSEHFSLFFSLFHLSVVFHHFINVSFLFLF